jgi:Tol biopolymer transport system component
VVIVVVLSADAARRLTIGSSAFPSGELTHMQPIPLANDLGGQFNPSLSPDGRHVVFDRRSEGRRQLLVKSTQSRTVRRLDLTGDVQFLDIHHASWSPRNDLIAFLVTDRPQIFGLHVVPATGGLARRLTTMAGIGLCWHPSGDSIGFVDRDGPTQPFSIHSISLLSGARARLTSPPSSAFGDTHCAFSPDGRELAVERHESRSASDLFLVDVATAGWSPDGHVIVFGSPSGLWQVSPRGPQPAAPTLVTGAEATVRAPRFHGSNRKTPSV